MKNRGSQLKAKMRADRDPRVGWLVRVSMVGNNWSSRDFRPPFLVSLGYPLAQGIFVLPSWYESP